MILNVFCLEKSRANWCPEQIEGIWQYINSDKKESPTFLEIKRTWGNEEGVIYHFQLLHEPHEDKVLNFLPEEVFFVPDGLNYQFDPHTTTTTCDKGVMNLQIKTSFSNEVIGFPTEMTSHTILKYILKKRKNGSLLFTAEGELDLTGLFNNIQSPEQSLYSFRTDQMIPASSFNSSQTKNPSPCPSINGSFEGLYNNYHFTTQRKRGKFHYMLDIEPKFKQLKMNREQYKFICGSNKLQIRENSKNSGKDGYDVKMNLVYNNQNLHLDLNRYRRIAYEKEEHIGHILDSTQNISYDFSLKNTQLETKAHQTWSHDMSFQYSSSHTK